MRACLQAELPAPGTPRRRSRPRRPRRATTATAAGSCRRRGRARSGLPRACRTAPRNCSDGDGLVLEDGAAGARHGPASLARRNSSQVERGEPCCASPGMAADRHVAASRSPATGCASGATMCWRTCCAGSARHCPTSMPHSIPKPAPMTTMGTRMDKKAAALLQRPSRESARRASTFWMPVRGIDRPPWRRRFTG